MVSLAAAFVVGADDSSHGADGAADGYFAEWFASLQVCLTSLTDGCSGP